MSYTRVFSIGLGAARTGLTLNAQLFDTTGTSVGSLITTGFVERGGGNYVLTASIPDDFRGGIDIINSANSAVLVSDAVNPEEVELVADILASLGASSGQYAVTFTVQAGLSAVQGATVTVRDSANTLIVAGPFHTDSSGQCTANLDAGTYKVTVSAGAGFDTLAVQTLTVSANASVTYTLTPTSVSPPADASLCTVYGYVRDGEGNGLENARLKFALRSDGPVLNSTTLVEVDRDYQATTDADGYFSIDLIRSDALTCVRDGDTATWLVTCAALRVENLALTLNAGSAEITSLLST